MTSRPSRFASSRRMVGGLLAAAALMAACESKLPTSAEINKMDAASAQKQVAGLAVDAGPARYLVDDKSVSAEVAKKLTAEQIATIEYSRPKAGDSSVISIRTVNYVGDSTRIKVADERAATGTFTRKIAGPPTMAKGVMLRRVGPDSGTAPITAPGEQQMKRKFDGLLIIDGKITESSVMETLDPERIETVEVVKGAAAMAKYSDPRAANGVIVVTTKAKK